MRTLSVEVNVNNMPSNLINDGNVWLVVRVDDHGAFWYYGLYNTELRARTAASEISNGIVLRLVEKEDNR